MKRKNIKLRSKIIILLIAVIGFHYSCAKSDFLVFDISTNYSEGKPYLTTRKEIANSNSKININFFKNHFSEFYGVPEEVIKRELKNQEITKWKFENETKDLKENWKEVYTYDSEGKLIEYLYSGCLICSQIPWGYKLVYNKNNNIVEQQVYYVEQISYEEMVDQIGINQLKKTPHIRKVVTYDSNQNIVKLETIGVNGLEQLIELIKR